ncbi:MAG: hypothetical protein OEV85_09505 [Candidatus Thorarchaeota archaeon]|nr:hypothetical protein [Candidatus Thorarchaeota archaeon]
MPLILAEIIYRLLDTFGWKNQVRFILLALIREIKYIPNVMKVTRVAVAERNYLRGILRTYLLGKKNQNYVIGCFRNVPIKVFDEVAKELVEYAQLPRFQELYTIRKLLEEALNKSESRTKWSPWVISQY